MLTADPPPHSDKLSSWYFAVNWKSDPDTFFSAETRVQEWTGFLLSAGRVMGGGQELGEKQHSAFMPLKRPKTKPDGQRNLQRSLRMIPLVRTFLVADSRSPSGRRSELGQVKKYPRRVMGTFQGLRKKHKEKSLSWEPTRSGQRQDFKTYKKDVFVCCAHARGTRSNSDSLSLHSRKVLLL